MTTVPAATCLPKAVNIHRQTHNTGKVWEKLLVQQPAQKQRYKMKSLHLSTTEPQPRGFRLTCRRGTIFLGYAAAAHKKHWCCSSTRQRHRKSLLFLTSLYIMPLKGIMCNFLIQWSSSPNCEFDVAIKPNRECSCVKVFITLITWPCRDLWGKRTDNVVEKKCPCFYQRIFKTAHFQPSV